MNKKDEYHTKGAYHYPPEIMDLVNRRVSPFLDRVGLQTRSVQHLLAEAYIQGIKDTLDAQASVR